MPYDDWSDSFGGFCLLCVAVLVVVVAAIRYLR
jgi:hypothetical protein